MKNILINVPHSSLKLSKEFLERILIDNNELQNELYLLTDLYTDKLINENKYECVIAKYSRLYCDVERFRDDRLELMSKKGMGAIYTHTSNGKSLLSFDDNYKNKVLSEYYDLYHNELKEKTDYIINKYGKVIIIDIHSFSSILIEKLKINTVSPLPDICIGFDNVFVDYNILNIIKNEFIKSGYKVDFNYPYSGSIVPLKYFNNRDKRVTSYMIEINKDVYLENDTVAKNKLNKLKNVLESIFNNITGDYDE